MFQALSVLQLCLRSPNCEEKTAYFILVSTCLSYLLLAPVSIVHVQTAARELKK